MNDSADSALVEVLLTGRLLVLVIPEEMKRLTASDASEDLRDIRGVDYS